MGQGNAYLVLTIDCVATTNSTGRAATRAVVAPAGTSLSVRTIASHVAGVTTDAADDAGSVVLALGAIVLAMTNLATVLAGLVLVVSQGTVEGGKFSQLVTLELVLSLRNRGSL